MIVEPGVVWSEADCARFARWLEALARAEVRRDGCSLPDELSARFWEMREVGDRYRDRYQASPEPGTGATMAGADMVVEDLAARLGVTGSYVRRLARTGVLPGRRVGAAWVFDSRAIEAFEKRRAG
jgi:excisionase family DNA binding protein